MVAADTHTRNRFNVGAFTTRGLRFRGVLFDLRHARQVTGLAIACRRVYCAAIEVTRACVLSCVCVAAHESNRAPGTSFSAPLRGAPLTILAESINV